ncbi:MAG TPA: LuxR C-terminal-related transcriptional regulator [bacterium]|nr:LuxR C-terminal-related transcriptional regulator [bacterium]
MDRKEQALASLKPDGPLSDGVAEGWNALNRGEWAEARARFETALASEETGEGWEGLAWAAWWLDDTTVMMDARERAYRLYRARGDARGAARSAMWLAVDYVDLRNDTAVANGWMQRAHRLLEQHTQSPEYAWLAACDAHHALMADKNPVTAQRLATEAVSVSEALGIIDVEMVGRALEGLALVSQGQVRDGMRRLDEAAAAAVAGELADRQAISLTCCYMIFACERVRDYPRAAQWCDRVKEFCRRWRFSMLFAVCRTQYAGVLIWRGEWAQAETELTTAARELTVIRPALAFSATTRLAELRRRQGRWDEATALFQRGETSTAALLGRAELALDQGNPAIAVDCAERYLRRYAPESRTERAPGLEVLARALAALGDLERGRTVLAELEETTQAVAAEPLKAFACVARGTLAACAGDHAQARTAFEDAADLFARFGAPFELGRARMELGRALAALGRRDAAAAELRTAVTVLQNLGAAHEAERAASLLREVTAEPTRRAAGPIARLTGKELEVLRLAAQGLTDKEIAARLRRSEHTIHRHVANILVRLDLPSRTAAVAYAVREGLL